MGILVPFGQLTGYLPQDAIGTKATDSNWVIWDAVADYYRGSLTNLVGLEPSPNGKYLLQKSVLNWFDANPTNWTVNTGLGDTGTYKQWVDPGSGAKGIYQGNGNNSTVFNLQYNIGHFTDTYGGGFTFRLYRPSPTTVITPYNRTQYGVFIYLNYPQGYAYAVGQPPLFGVMIAPSEPISLQISYDNINWQTIDQLNGTDSEMLLDSSGRVITFDVVPLFDISWWESLPQSQAGYPGLGILPSSRPPDSLQVTVNGGNASSGVLVCNIDRGTFNAGSLAITGIGGSFGLSYAAREYVPNFTLGDDVNQNQSQFYGDPETSLLAYIPANTQWALTPIYPPDTIGQVAVTLTGTSGSINLSTGNSYSTVAINQLQLYWAPIFNGPYGGGPQWQYNFFSGESLSDGPSARVIYWRLAEQFTQAAFCRRSTLEIKMNNSDLSITPANVPLANRVVTWSYGWVWYDFDSDGALINTVPMIEEVAFTGEVCMDDGSEGYAWELVDALYSLEMMFSDFLDESVKCGYMPAMDGYNMYFVVRQLGYKLGFNDNRMLFPIRTINDATAEFHLEVGSSFAPKWQPDPNDGAVDFLLRVRDACGAPDPTGATDFDGNPLIVPMVVFVDSFGNLRFEPWNVGWVNLFSPSVFQVVPNIAKSFTIGEQFDSTTGAPLLCQLLSIRTSVDLSVIRTNIQLVGRNPISGKFVFNGSVNNTLDGSSVSNPNAEGYIGKEKDLFIIDPQFTSQQAVDQTLELQEQQASFPAIRAKIGAMAQPGFHALDGYFGNPYIGVDVPGVTGNIDSVPFWIQSIDTVGRFVPTGDESGSFTPEMTTNMVGRGIGQAGN